MAIGPYTTDVLVFAGTTNNVRSQSDYLTLSPAGNVLGTQGDSSLVNKALRQVSVVANTLTKLVADRNSVNITDGTTPLTQAILYPLLEAALNQQTIPLPISQGGTNTTTLTTNQVLTVGTNASGQQAITGVAPGNSGNVLTSNGTVWTSSLPLKPGLGGIQVFNSNGVFTIPIGVTTIKVTVVGAGGGGGTTASFSNRAGAGGGGGGGAYAIKYFLSLTPGSTINVTVGLGGDGAISGVAPPNGMPGSLSQVTSGSQSITPIICNGGGGGGTGFFSTPGAGGAGGTIVNNAGDLNFPGSSGGPGFVYGVVSTSIATHFFGIAYSGSGGSSNIGKEGKSGIAAYLGPGASLGTGSFFAGINGNGPGAGGSGSAFVNLTSSIPNGGNGANGIVIFEW